MLFSLMFGMMACTNDPIKLIDSGTTGITESGTTNNSENGGSENGGSENGGSENGGTETGDTGTTTTPSTDYSVWLGSRTYVYDYTDYNSDWYCEDTVGETGTALVEGESAYELLQSECAICQWFYVITPESSTACDWIELGTTYRAVAFSDDSAAVYLYREEDGSMTLYAQDTAASFDGTSLGYGYATEAYYYGWIAIEVDVTGEVTYPVQ